MLLLGFFLRVCVVVQKRIFFSCVIVWKKRALWTGGGVRLWEEEKALATTTTTTMAFVLVVTVVLVNGGGEKCMCVAWGSDDDGSHSTVLFVGYFCGKRRAQNSLKAKKCVGLTENHEKWRCITMIAPTHNYSLQLKCMTTMK